MKWRHVALVLLLTCSVPAETTASESTQKKVKVFILAGQSNMEGYGQLRSLDHLGSHPKFGHLLKRLKAGDGSWAVRDDVTICWQSEARETTSGPLSVGWGGGPDTIGPELMFGTIMGDAFDAPVLLIKAAWGGRDVFCDFRSPSAGELTPDEARILERDRQVGNRREVGRYYRRLVREIRDALENIDKIVPGYHGQGYEVAGLAWLQGWNDFCEWHLLLDDRWVGAGVIRRYPHNLAAMIRDLRKDLGVPNVPVVIGELGVLGREAERRAVDEDDREARSMVAFRVAQRAVAEDPELENVAFVSTADFWDGRLQELRVIADRYWDEKQKKGIESTKENELPTRELNEEYWRRGGHWVCHYNGSASTYSLIGFALARAFVESPGAPSDYELKPVPFNEVEMKSDFWRPRLITQRETLVPFAFERTRPGVEHLQAARDFLAGKKVEGHRAHRFIDSDLYKVMEGAAYLLQLRRDAELEARLDELAELIAAAQHESGYLYPSHTTGVGASRNMMGDAPYTFVVHSHELYNVGHLYEAAIAYYRATGKRKLLEVAEKSARHINQVFFSGDPAYNDGNPVLQAPGHQEIELALVKLFRVAGNELYLDMARRFLEIRGVTYVPEGEGVMAPTYAQQHAPVLEQREAVGHAVRATYLYCAMADVGTLTGDARYAKALDRIWGDITNTRMHITGGLGAVHGIEGFGPQYELPNADAFNETCAAVGNVLFNHRMFLLHKDAKYLDVAEVALLNNVLAAVNLEGNRFFYVNPLEADGKYPFNHGTAGRAPWFGTACCPSNMARLIPQVPAMAYAHDDQDLYLTFYAESRTRVDLGGVRVSVEQKTAYPEDGKVRVLVEPEKPTRFRLRLRIPGWTGDRFVPGELYRYVSPGDESVTLSVNGDPVEVRPEKGFATIDREWQAGDQVLLNLPMPVRVSGCRPEVESNRSRVALTRGPFVLCAEGVDNGGATQRIFFDELPDTSKAVVRRRTVGAGAFIQVGLPARAVAEDGRTDSAKLIVIPYYAWNNRGVSSMTVWFPRDRSLAVHDPHALPTESVFSGIKASHTSELDTLSAIGDGKEPRWSSGRKVPRWTSRPEKGKPQWVEARFHVTKTVRSVGVYWMQDRRDVWFPKEWSLEVEQSGAWKPFELYTTDRYETRANQYNVVHPAAPLRCEAIRIRMTPREDACVGILEVKVAFE